MDTIYPTIIPISTGISDKNPLKNPWTMMVTANVIKATISNLSYTLSFQQNFRTWPCLLL